MILSIVVPCFNEEAVLKKTSVHLIALLEKLSDKKILSKESHIILVDDGSTDSTWGLIKEKAHQCPSIRGLKLSRNQGHQNALLAGLLTADGDAVISIDADLQDDLGVIIDMVNAHKNGSDVVYGVRKNRDTDTFYKRITAETYYHVLQAFRVQIVFNHADYRLMSRRAIEALRHFKEINLFLRGIVPQIGFQSTIVYYDRKERVAGQSKYPFTKMMALAWQGITSFSSVPLRMITVVGVIVSIGSFCVALWAIAIKLFTDLALPGWASTVAPIYLLGGVQLLSIGVIGEYLAKIYMETKRRPLFFIEEKIGFRKLGQG